MTPVSNIVLREYVPGQKITVPGIYSNVPIKTYHRDICAGPSISSGGLRKIESESLEHFYDESWLNPLGEPPAEKEAWLFGRAAHLLLLGEAGFQTEFAVRPDCYPDDPSKPWNGNSNSCKAWLAEKAVQGVSVLKPDAVPNIRGMADKLAAHPTVQAGILNGLAEKSIFWKRRIKVASGNVVTIWLKARPDNLLIDGTLVSDLKSCDDASPVAVRRSISDYGYEQQMALAAEGMLATTGRRITDAVLVFVEKKRPFSINIKPLDPIALEYGHRQNYRAMLKFAEALDTGIWSGYDDDEVPAQLTDYKAKRLAFEAEKGLLPPVDESPDFDQPADEEAV